MAFGVASGLPGVASPDQVFPAPTAGVAMVAAAAAALALTPAASSHLLRFFAGLSSGAVTAVVPLAASSFFFCSICFMICASSLSNPCAIMMSRYDRAGVLSENASPRSGEITRFWRARAW